MYEVKKKQVDCYDERNVEEETRYFENYREIFDYVMEFMKYPYHTPLVDDVNIKNSLEIEDSIELNYAEDADVYAVYITIKKLEDS